MTRRSWALVTFAVAVLTGLVLVFLPVISTTSCVTSSSGASACSSGTRTLLENEGAGVLFVLAVPAVLALAPVLVPSRRASVLAAAGLTVAMVLALASIGLFLVPTVVLAWVAAGRSRPGPTPRAVPG